MFECYLSVHYLHLKLWNAHFHVHFFYYLFHYHSYSILCLFYVVLNPDAKYFSSRGPYFYI